MKSLPTTSFASRLNALLAATVVTLAMLSGIDALAGAEAAPQWAQASATQPA